MAALAYIRLIVALHAAFAGMFFFLNRQHPTKFARYLAWSWSIEALRAAFHLLVPALTERWVTDLFALSDVLQVLANWLLLAGCADLAEVHLPKNLQRWYYWVSVPLLLFNRFGLPVILAHFGAQWGRSVFWGVLINQIILFIPVTITRFTIIYWFFRIWKATRLPGAMVAAVFCIPYAVIAIAYPFEYYFGYNPDWIASLWFVRVLGFSVGLVMLLLNQQLSALQKSESRLAAAQAIAKLGSWEFDIATGKRTWSAEMFRLLGRDVSLGPASDADFCGMIHPDSRAEFDHYYSAGSAQAGAPRQEYRILRPDRSTLWIEARNDLVVDAEGKSVRLTGTVQDITEKKRFEEQFLRAQRVENLGLLAAGIAHDFNNILTPIIMVGPVLREEIGDSGSRELLATVEASAERGKALVRQILSFAQGTATGKILLQPEPVARDLASLVFKTFPSSIKIELHMARDPWTVYANPTQLHQVLLNLCINARDAMPSGGTLSLSLSNCALDGASAGAIPGGRAGKFTLFEVGDTGTGIPPEVLCAMWEPFFTTKSFDKGTGLGLSTVRGIVNEHNGFCGVSTEEGRGTTFRVYLPFAESTPAPPPAP